MNEILLGSMQSTTEKTQDTGCKVEEAVNLTAFGHTNFSKHTLSISWSGRCLFPLLLGQKLSHNFLFDDSLVLWVSVQYSSIDIGQGNVFPIMQC